MSTMSVALKLPRFLGGKDAVALRLLEPVPGLLAKRHEPSSMASLAQVKAGLEKLGYEPGEFWTQTLANPYQQGVMAVNATSRATAALSIGAIAATTGYFMIDRTG